MKCRLVVFAIEYCQKYITRKLKEAEMKRILYIQLLSLLVMFSSGCNMRGLCNSKCDTWVDVYRGEPVSYTDMITDISTADVIYLGEKHTIDLHHEIQLEIVMSLADKGKQIILGMEQLERRSQPVIDKYNRGEIDFDTLAAKVDWPSMWSNYLDYRDIVEAVHDSGGKIIGLNAGKEIVRSVARFGIEKLSEKERAELPDDLDFSESPYKKYLKELMFVMAHVRDDKGMLERMYAAQVCRDETMADSLAAAINDNKVDNVVSVVICGSGHVMHSAGTPARLQRRMPGTNERIIILSDSGNLVMSKKEKAMSRNITITHDKYRCFDSSISDYLHIVGRN